MRIPFISLKERGWSVCKRKEQSKPADHYYEYFQKQKDWNLYIALPISIKLTQGLFKTVRPPCNNVHLTEMVNITAMWYKIP